MKIDKHISTLLYNYDCVIVPELGGFVCNYKPAQIHPVQHLLSPPQKNVVFNGNLKNNDGLLINQVSVEEGKTYNDAQIIVQQYVQQTIAQLGKGEKVEVNEVGTLHYDAEQNIQFLPEEKTNFLLNSFGLDKITSPAIKRDGHVKRLEKEFKDRVIPLEKNTKGKRKIYVRRMVALALLAPIIFAAVWIPVRTDFLYTGNISSLNPFAAKELAKYKHADKPVAVYEHTILNTVKTNYNEIKTVKLTENATHSIVIKPEEKTIAPADNTSVKTEELPVTVKSTPGTYYIIGGCFEVYDNATRFAETLRSKGYSAAIIDKSLGRLHPVAYSTHSTKEEALAELAKVRTQDSNAWLLTY
jgi:hypothetical protein